MRAAALRTPLLGLAAAIVLAACPNPVTNLTVNQVSDRSAPVVSFSAPAEGAAYTQTVSVQGTASDAGRLKGVSWAVTGTLGTLASGNLEPASLGAGGSFSFTFDTLDFSGPLAVSIQATDWNDNIGTGVRTLTAPGAALSSFTVDPGNRSVQLDWDLVAGATYTLYFTRNGTLPGLGFGEQIILTDPPQPLSGLTNGSRHVLLLRASAGGKDYWSGYVEAVPLAETTLAPAVTGQFAGIRVSWNQIPATDSFEVLRSTQRDASFANISGTVTGTTFIDTDVAPGTRYFYKVRPAIAGSRESAPVAGEATPFPLDADRRVGYIIPEGLGVKDVAIAGAFAFAANYEKGLQVFDVSDPAHPVMVGSYGTGSDKAMGIGLNPAATIAYLAAGNFVYAINVSTPTSPAFVAKSGNLGAPAQDATVRGSDVFVAAAGAGVLKFTGGDVSSSPASFIPAANGGGNAYGIASDANNVYVAAEARAFVLNPSNLSLRGWMTASRAMGIAAATSGSTTYAIVADETPRILRLFDVTVPSSIGTLGTLVLSGLSPRGVAVRWPFAALTGTISTGGAALQVVNLVDPLTPRLVFPVALPTHTEGVALSGDHAYVAGFGLQIVNIANPAAPAVEASAPALGLGYVHAVDGDLAVAATFGYSLHAFSLANPSSPLPLGLPFGTASLAYGIAVRWPYAYLAEFGGLQIVNLTGILSGKAPDPAGFTTLVGNGNDIAVSGDYAFVAGSSNSVDIVSIANPSQPRIVGNFVATGFVQGIAARGATAYAVTLGGFTFPVLSVFSAANPALPQTLGTVVLAGLGAGAQVNSLTLAGDHAYLSVAPGFGMAIVDISNPASPTLKNVTPLGFDGRFVEVVGDYAFVTPVSGTTLRVFNISDRQNPRLVGTVVQEGVVIRGSGAYTFVTDYTGGKFVPLRLW